MRNEIEFTKMSSRGQIVIPQDIRESMNLKEGTPFAVMKHDDTIVLKKIKMPSPKETFEKISEWGQRFAKERGLKEGDVEKIIHKRRGVKDA